jgi:hypothetical protein
MVPPPPVVRDLPDPAHLDGILKNKRVLGHLAWRDGSVSRRRQDLHALAVPSPGPGDAEATETAIPPYLDWSSGFNLLDYAGPLSAIESRTRFYGNQLFIVSVGELNAAR